MSDFIGYRGRVEQGRLTALVARHGVLESATGIDTRSALQWLSRHVTGRWGKFRVCYGFDLEANLLLADLPDDHMARLLDGDTVAWGGYKLEWLPGMLLHVKPNNAPGVVLYDLAGWFRKELSRAVDDIGGSVPEVRSGGQVPTHTALAESQRETFAAELEHISLLEMLGERLNSGAMSISSVGALTRFYGPGALASKALGSVGARLHIAKFTREKSNPILYDAFSRGYYGGRIELLQMGGFDRPIWAYDMNNAYGAGLAELAPIGRFWAPVEPTRLHELDMAVWQVRWSIPDSKRHLPGPFPWRNAAGLTTYPANGQGYYWSPEVRAALRAYPDGEIRVGPGYAHAAKRKSVISGLAQAVYAERQIARGRDPMTDLLLKVLIPAIYGKLAQRKGRATFSCLPAAGFVTSHVRATMLDAVRQAPDAIIAIATDALYSTRPLDLPIGDELGQWRVNVYAGGTFISPGVYRLVDQDGSQKHRSRGFVATTAEFSAIVTGLANPSGVALQRRVFISHALARVLPREYRAHKLTVLTLPYHLQPYTSMKRVYDIRHDADQEYAPNPIADWRRESRRSWQVIGGPSLSACHDLVSTVTTRAAAEASGARAVVLGEQIPAVGLLPE